MCEMIFSKNSFSVLLLIILFLFYGCEGHETKKQEAERKKLIEELKDSIVKSNRIHAEKLCFKEKMPSFCYLLAYEHIKDNKVVNKKQFLKYAEKGCSLGGSQACDALGYYWEYERNNLEKAYDYNKKGCAAGSIESCLSASAYASAKDKENKNHILFAIKACDLGRSLGCFFAGRFLLYENKKKDAAEYFSEGCSMRDGRSCANAALIYLELKEEKKADSLIEKAISSGKSAEAFKDIAIYMDKTGALDKSYQFLEKAIEKDPEILPQIEKSKDFRKMRETARYKKTVKKVLNKKKE